MNHIYRSIFNERTGTSIAVAENAKCHGKKSAVVKRALVSSGFVLHAVALGTALSPGSIVHASPQGGTVVAGDATINSNAANTTINQTSQSAILNWQRFDIGIGETVNFVQPNNTSVALNRVLGADPSTLLGNLSANGKVFLINPNGILFGTDAQVNVGALVASTRDMTDTDFLAGRYTFRGTSNGFIENFGSIDADGGYVALLGAHVSNQGVIAARLGSVALAAGDAITLDVAGDGLLNVAVNAGAVDALASNGGLIRADGGQVLLTAQSASNLLSSAVNNTGLIQAHTIDNSNGVIRLLGDMHSGTVNAGGTLDASAPNGGDGGFVETSAAHVQIAPSIAVTTSAAHGASGRWLIDPVDFTIAPSGGDITGTTLSANLSGGNILIQSGAGAGGVHGDIHVNDTVTWSANRLTLDAYRNININTALNGAGTASLALEYGQGAVAAGNPAVVNVRAPVNLPTGNNFSMTRGSDGAVVNYAVINDMAGVQAMNSNRAGNYALGSNLDATGVAGFVPIGPVNAHNDSGNQFSGIFDGLGHTISHLTINRPANNFVGFFGGLSGTGIVRNIGLTDVYVRGVYEVGAIVSFNYGTVSNSYAVGTVIGQGDVGGLIGYQRGGAVENSYANVAVSNSGSWGETAGGLVADNEGGIIRDSYATGTVSGEGVGGLLGTNRNGTVINSYATGLVTSSGSAGGLIAREYFTPTVTNSFWNVTTSGQAFSSGGAGLTTAQIQSALPTGFSSSIWGNADNQSTPYLLNNPGRALIVTDTSATYYNIVLNVSQLQAMNANLGGNYALGNDIAATATGGWNSGTGFAPVGNVSTPFTGRFDGLSHTIDNLSIIRPATDYVGLFGFASAAQIRNVGLMNAQITGRDSVGALMGATVVGTASGLAATGQVTGRNSVGGLIGYNNSMPINTSYATNAVTGANNVGGLMGETNGGTPTQLNYATGNVTGSGTRVGGLVGYNGFGFEIVDSYATGSVGGTSEVGGLVGYHYNGSISRSYSIGAVTGTSFVGGLIGRVDTGPVTNSYWNSQTSGQATSAGGTARTSAEMLQRTSFVGWNFNTTWIGYDGHTNPLLRTFMTGLTVTLGDATKTYDGLAYSGGNGVNYSSTPNGSLLGSLSFGGTSQGATNAGTYAIAGSDLYSNQQGYIIDYVNGTLTVERAILTASVLAPDKVYDGNTTASATLTAITGLIGSETVGASAAASFNSKDVADANLVTVDSVTLADGTNGGLASNYFLASGQTTVAHITPQILSATLAASDKVYDGNATASATLTALTGLIGSETISANADASFNSRNVADANIVTVGTVTLADGANGGLASNYTLTSGQSTVAHITPKGLTVVGQRASDKTFDGTTTATLTDGSLAGLVAGDSVVLNQAGAFADASVGADVAVTATNTLSGTEVTNYSLTQPTGLSADIVAAIVPEAPPQNPPDVPPEAPPPSAAPLATYHSAVAYVAGNVQTAPAPTPNTALQVNTQVISAPATSQTSGSSSTGLVSYDVSGLNLTIVVREHAAPSTRPQNTTDDRDDKR
jgi:filamentous hemagglutinin family protein